MFNAITILDCGAELEEDRYGDWPVPVNKEWEHIVHFDIQPGNCKSQSRPIKSKPFSTKF